MQTLLKDVRKKRVFAFCLDFIAISLLYVVLSIPLFFVGILTLGLGFLLYGILWQVIALFYCSLTLGGPNAATPGMRAMGLQMRTLSGTKPYPVLAGFHVILFYCSVVIITPFVLLISLFSNKKRLLHDILLGTVIINAPQ